MSNIIEITTLETTVSKSLLWVAEQSAATQHP